MRCHDFLLKAYQQLETRVRDSKAVFKGLSYLTPQKVLAQATRANFQELPFPSLRAKDEIDLQYLKILFVDWKSELGEILLTLFSSGTRFHFTKMQLRAMHLKILPCMPFKVYQCQFQMLLLSAFSAMLHLLNQNSVIECSQICWNQ